MFVDAKRRATALRQEGHVCRRQAQSQPPSVMRAMFINARRTTTPALRQEGHVPIHQ